MIKRISLVIIGLLFVWSSAATLTAWWGVRRHLEAVRLQQNQTALFDSLHRYRTRLNAEAASVAALSLRCEEYRRLRRADAERIRELGLRLRRVESVSTSALVTQAQIESVVADTVAGADTVLHFGWSDAWVSVRGTIAGDTVRCSVVSVDTLRQVVHRIPHRFLFLRFGTKALRQEIVCSNPHTHIVCAEYIELKRKSLRRQRKN